MCCSYMTMIVVIIIIIIIIIIMLIVIITIVKINDKCDDKFVSVRCNNTGEPKKGISMH